MYIRTMFSLGTDVRYMVLWLKVKLLQMILV